MATVNMEYYYYFSMPGPVPTYMLDNYDPEKSTVYLQSF